MNKSIEFSIEATVKQRIELISDVYDENDIALLLEEGTLKTTTWFNHDDLDKAHNYIEDHKGNRVAKILSQEVEGSYFDFE